MATVGETSRPGYVYDSATDVWIPVGIGPHSHTPAAIGAISSSVVTTKGDLIVATGSGVVTRQGVGADGSYLVADSTQADGLNWAGPSNMAGRNSVLNSNFSVWQRGTSIVTATGASLGYGPDRWQLLRSAFATGATVSRQVTNDTTNLPAIQYCARVQRDSGNSGVGVLYFQQNFESVNSIPYAGKTVTLSFYARKGADYSTTSSGLTAQVVTGTGTDQNYHAAGYTGLATPINSTVTLTTTWQRFTISGTLATTATELNINFSNTPAGTASTNDYYEITGVQLEVGSVATPYAPNGATYQAELAACQRYYFRQGGAQAYQYFAQGLATSTTNARILVNLPVQMRINPTSIDALNLSIYDISVQNAVTATSFDNTAPLQCSINCTTSGITVNRPVILLANATTNSYFGISAEL